MTVYYSLSADDDAAPKRRGRPPGPVRPRFKLLSGRAPALDAAPLRSFVRAEVTRRRTTIQALADEVRRRTGVPMRHRLDALMSTERITIDGADVICTALDSHIGEVWGWDVYEELGTPEVAR